MEALASLEATLLRFLQGRHNDRHGGALGGADKFEAAVSSGLHSLTGMGRPLADVLPKLNWDTFERGVRLCTGLASLYLALQFIQYMSSSSSPPGEDSGPSDTPTEVAPGVRARLTRLEASIFKTCSINLVGAKGAGATDPFARVGGLEAVLTRLRQQAVLPLQQPHLLAHSELLQVPSGVLLYGPPGTGKTLLARCLAQSTKATFLSFSPSSLQNMYVGQSAKLVTAAFSLARKCAPCIMFFDELDGLLPKRDGMSAMNPFAQEFIANFLSAWEGVGGAGGGSSTGSSAGKGTGSGTGSGTGTSAGKWVLVVAASNRPWALDPAALRRLPCQVEVPLPNREERASILLVLLRGDRCAAGLEEALGELAGETEGFSGSDLRELVKTAVLVPVQESLGGGADAVRGITEADMFAALDSVRPAEEKSAQYLARVNKR